MNNTHKTVVFIEDEEVYLRLERLKNILSYANINDVIKECINSKIREINNQNISWARFPDLVKEYVIALYLTKITKNRNMQELDFIIDAIERTYEEYSYEEVKEIASLLDEEQPKTVGSLLRFKHRIAPIAFLCFMGESEEELVHLSDESLVEFLMKKFEDNTFREEAKRLFDIQYS